MEVNLGVPPEVSLRLDLDLLHVITPLAIPLIVNNAIAKDV